MNVSQILNDNSRVVLTIFADQPLLDVVDILTIEAVGALVVVNDRGALVGIISERDIVRILAAHGGNAMDRRVSEFMTRHVVTVTLDESVDDVLAKMSKGRFRHTPVVQRGNLIGMVTSGDLIKSRLDTLEREQDAFRDYIAAA